MKLLNFVDSIFVPRNIIIVLDVQVFVRLYINILAQTISNNMFLCMWPEHMAR